ncbi:unnamed protein product [Ascophyllum nodosum]
MTGIPRVHAFAEKCPVNGIITRPFRAQVYCHHTGLDWYNFTHVRSTPSTEIYENVCWEGGEVPCNTEDIYCIAAVAPHTSRHHLSKFPKRLKEVGRNDLRSTTHYNHAIYEI